MSTKITEVNIMDDNPTYEQLIKERLMNIADLMGIDWNEFDCELHFLPKLDFELEESE
jgi:GMP synthase PP-ATPase subunit